MGIVDAVKGLVGIKKSSQNIPEPIQISSPILPALQDHSNYAEPFYRNQEENLRVDSQQSTINFILDSHFSRSAESAMIAFTRSAFDRNILFSYHINLIEAEIEYLYFLIDLLVCRGQTHKSDTIKPQYMHWEQMMKQQFRNRITRTVGVDRWSTMLMKIQGKYEIQVTKPIQEQK